MVKLLFPRVNDIAAKYKWKAENIVRFFEKLGMTTEEKEAFLAKELANAYILGTINRLDREEPGGSVR